MSTIELSITGDDGIRRVLITNRPMTREEGAPDNAPSCSNTFSNTENLNALIRTEGWRASQTCFAGFTMFLPVEPMDTEIVDMVAALRSERVIAAEKKLTEMWESKRVGYAVGHVSGAAIVTSGEMAKDDVGFGVAKPAI